MVIKVMQQVNVSYFIQVFILGFNTKRQKKERKRCHKWGQLIIIIMLSKLPEGMGKRDCPARPRAGQWDAKVSTQFPL